MSNILINLIKTFLLKRYIIIKFGNKMHRHFNSKDCPQGAVLRPAISLIIAQIIFDKLNYEHATLLAFEDDFLIITRGQH